MIVMVTMIINKYFQKGKKMESKTFLKVGQKVLIRTVTMIYAGEIKDIGEREILLTKASWIADTGRFSENLKSCDFSEVEMYHNDVVVFTGAFLDVTEIDRIPTATK